MSTRSLVLTAGILLAATLGSSADPFTTGPDPSAIRQAAARCAPGSTTPPGDIVGISDPNTLDPRVIDLIKETGVQWVRAEFHWSRIQPAPGVPYSFASYDNMVRNLRSAGVDVLGILTYIPPSYPRDWDVIAAGFRDFTAATVERYAPMGVNTWEIFNEPNLTGFGWLDKGLDARQYLGAYVLLLAEANRVIRSRDSDAVIVLGGLASDNHGGIPAEEVMREIYHLGAKECFDVLAFHPYGYQSKFTEARKRVDRMLAAGDDLGKPVWFNEYGWTDYRSMDMAVNDSARNNPMIATFSQLSSADALFWFSAKDFSRRWGAPTFGLADYDFNKRASFETFRAIVAATKP